MTSIPEHIPLPTNEQLQDTGGAYELFKSELPKDVQNILPETGFQSQDEFIQFLSSHEVSYPNSWSARAGGSGLWGSFSDVWNPNTNVTNSDYPNYTGPYNNEYSEYISSAPDSNYVEWDPSHDFQGATVVQNQFQSTPHTTPQDALESLQSFIADDFFQPAIDHYDALLDDSWGYSELNAELFTAYMRGRAVSESVAFNNIKHCLLHYDLGNLSSENAVNATVSAIVAQYRNATLSLLRKKYNNGNVFSAQNYGGKNEEQVIKHFFSDASNRKGFSPEFKNHAFLPEDEATQNYFNALLYCDSGSSEIDWENSLGAKELMDIEKSQAFLSVKNLIQDARDNIQKQQNVVKNFDNPKDIYKLLMIFPTAQAQDILYDDVLSIDKELVELASQGQKKPNSIDNKTWELAKILAEGKTKYNREEWVKTGMTFGVIVAASIVGGLFGGPVGAVSGGILTSSIDVGLEEQKRVAAQTLVYADLNNSGLGSDEYVEVLEENRNYAIIAGAVASAFGGGSSGVVLTKEILEQMGIRGFWNICKYNMVAGGAMGLADGTTSGLADGRIMNTEHNEKQIELLNGDPSSYSPLYGLAQNIIFGGIFGAVAGALGTGFDFGGPELLLRFRNQNEPELHLKLNDGQLLDIEILDISDDGIYTARLADGTTFTFTEDGTPKVITSTPEKPRLVIDNENPDFTPPEIEDIPSPDWETSGTKKSALANMLSIDHIRSDQIPDRTLKVAIEMAKSNPTREVRISKFVTWDESGTKSISYEVSLGSEKNVYTTALDDLVNYSPEEEAFFGHRFESHFHSFDTDLDSRILETKGADFDTDLELLLARAYKNHQYNLENLDSPNTTGLPTNFIHEVFGIGKNGELAKIKFEIDYDPETGFFIHLEGTNIDDQAIAAVRSRFESIEKNVWDHIQNRTSEPSLQLAASRYEDLPQTDPGVLSPSETLTGSYTPRLAKHLQETDPIPMSEAFQKRISNMKEGDKIIFGRSQTNMPSEFQAPYISSQHFEIALYKGNYFIRDLGSTNSTGIRKTNGDQFVVNGTKCYSVAEGTSNEMQSPWMLLEPGDELLFLGKENSITFDPSPREAIDSDIHIQTDLTPNQRPLVSHFFTKNTPQEMPIDLYQKLANLQEGQTVRFGSSQQGSPEIFQNSNISSSHLEITRHNGEIYLRDLNSEQGTGIILKDGTKFILQGNQQTNLETGVTQTANDPWVRLIDGEELVIPGVGRIKFRTPVTVGEQVHVKDRYNDWDSKTYEIFAISDNGEVIVQDETKLKFKQFSIEEIHKWRNEAVPLPEEIDKSLFNCMSSPPFSYVLGSSSHSNSPIFRDPDISENYAQITFDIKKGNFLISPKSANTNITIKNVFGETVHIDSTTKEPYILTPGDSIQLGSGQPFQFDNPFLTHDTAAAHMRHNISPNYTNIDSVGHEMSYANRLAQDLPHERGIDSRLQNMPIVASINISPEDAADPVTFAAIVSECRLHLKNNPNVYGYQIVTGELFYNSPSESIHFEFNHFYEGVEQAPRKARHRPPHAQSASTTPSYNTINEDLFMPSVSIEQLKYEITDNSSLTPVSEASIPVTFGKNQGTLTRQMETHIPEAEVYIGPSKDKFVGAMQIVNNQNGSGNAKMVLLTAHDQDGNVRQFLFPMKDIVSIRHRTEDLTGEFNRVENPQFRDKYINKSSGEYSMRVLIDYSDPKLATFLSQFDSVINSLESGQMRRSEAAQYVWNVIRQLVPYDKPRLETGIHKEIYSLSQFIDKGVCNERGMLLQVCLQYVGIKSHMEKGIYNGNISGRHAWVRIDEPEYNGFILDPQQSTPIHPNSPEAAKFKVDNINEFVLPKQDTVLF